jgi:hypothetical protein
MPEQGATDPFGAFRIAHCSTRHESDANESWKTSGSPATPQHRPKHPEEFS